MLTKLEITKCGDYIYNGVRNLIDWETSYIETRNKSTRNNLPKTALNILECVSGTVKGITVAAVLGYGAPLPITVLATISLFPPKTLKHLATKINKFNYRFVFSNPYNQIENSMVFQEDDLSSYDQLNIKKCLTSFSIETLGIAQYLITNGLTFYQKLFPTNWLQIMTVEAIEQSIRWYYGGTLPTYYTENAMSDWVWMVSGVGGEILQNYRFLNNSYFINQFSINHVQLRQGKINFYNKPYYQGYNVRGIVLLLNQNLPITKINNFIIASSLASIGINTPISFIALPLFFINTEAASVSFDIPFQISQNGIQVSLNSPVMAKLKNGNSVVIYSNLNNHIDGQILDYNENKIGSTFGVDSTYLDGNNDIYKVTTNNNGFLVEYVRYVGLWDSTCLFGLFFNFYGKKISDIIRIMCISLYFSEINLSSLWPYIATLSNDNFVATWKRDTSIKGAIIKATDFSVIYTFQVTSSSSANSPYSMATLSNNNFVVVWETGNVYGQIFDNIGSAVGSSFSIASMFLSPVVATIGNNRFIVTGIGTNNIIVCQVFDNAANRIGSIFPVGNIDQKLTFISNILSMPDYSQFVVLTTTNSYSNNIPLFGQIYDISDDVGKQIGNKFLITNLTASTSRNFQLPAAGIALLSDATFMVTWSNYWYDLTKSISGNYIFGQIFKYIVPVTVTNTGTLTPSITDTNTDTTTIGSITPDSSGIISPSSPLKPNSTESNKELYIGITVGGGGAVIVAASALFYYYRNQIKNKIFPAEQQLSHPVDSSPTTNPPFINGTRFR